MKTEKGMYEKPRIIELGEVSELTKWSAVGPFDDGNSDHARSWKSG